MCVRERERERGGGEREREHELSPLKRDSTPILDLPKENIFIYTIHSIDYPSFLVYSSNNILRII